MPEEKMSEVTAEKQPLAEPLLQEIPARPALPAKQEAAPARTRCPSSDLEPICIEDEPAQPSPKGKVKASSSNNPVYRLGSNQCFHCLITFPDEKFKERHMKREHPEDFVQENLRDALFVCFICSKPFESSRALICHQRGHAPAPPPDCPDCLRPAFECPDCGRRFGQLVSYQRHRLGHAAGRSLPHQCPDCGKSFRQLSNLRRHQASHQRPLELLPSRPYSCTECGESFAQEAGLHEHYIRHARGEL
ncbi:zinc finger protein 576 isoform X2 [Caretta caretta]|uniref:zinc finger protein 576 isoform X2 n=2 Tax=Cheloniidae TaxID=8465 RepID=UPI0020963E6C|nr:zinc finger protein 576 isoform X1 [Caretta caretta]